MLGIIGFILNSRVNHRSLHCISWWWNWKGNHFFLVFVFKSGLFLKDKVVFGINAEESVRPIRNEWTVDILIFVPRGNSSLWMEDSRNLSKSSDGNLNLRAALQCFCFRKIFSLGQNSRITERVVTRIFFEDPRPKWGQTRTQTKFNEGWHWLAKVFYVWAHLVSYVERA